MTGMKLSEMKNVDQSLLCEALASADVSDAELSPEFDSDEYTVLPGFCDVHVHFREPGFSYKETIETGCAAAAHGGFTAVCTMPNLNPVPDSAEHLEAELACIRRGASIAVYPYGALTVGERGEKIAALEEMADRVIAFSDDGRGVQSELMMLTLMRNAAALGKIIAAHCEDNSLLHGGYVHDSPYAVAHGHDVISSESEWEQVERDLRLAEVTGCAYHVCHISTKESVDLIRHAKAHGVNVTCETAPHYLVFHSWDLRENGRFKMNPPIRNERDRVALIEGLLDGTIDMIATDHAPHSAEEKSKGLRESAFGVVGLETAFPALYTALVREGILPLSQLLELMAVNPRKRFGIPAGGFSVWRLGESFTVDSDRFLSMGRSTPWEGRELYGKNCLTSFGRQTVFCEKEVVYQ